ncbi:MAG TPA: hypothetical protein VFX44_10325 [Solirubrobacterales bacterium]|nr:hypothetical protein [Solirubrobacterales bacterium]
MNDQTPINARPKRRSPDGVEDVSLALREYVVWPVEDAFLGLSDRGRIAAATGAAALALGIGVLGFSALGSDGSQPASAPVAVAPTPAPSAAPHSPAPKAVPTLHGATPVFKPAPKGEAAVGGSEEVQREAAAAAASNTGNAATDTISSSPAAHPAGAPAAASASASAAPLDGPPAGPAAISVARKFAEGFVVYETGGDKSIIRKAFAQTATPELTKALLRRPPRQPAGVVVPQAKVVNVVPAPSHGTVYPLSVSLLRVGVTSELRLEMEQLKNKEWRVTNVLG